MSASPALDAGALQSGLLLEAATKHQTALDAQLQSLQIHMQQLDAVVRDTVRRAVVEECADLTHEATQTAAALRGLARDAGTRLLRWSILALLLPAALGAAALLWLLPSTSQLQGLWAQRQQFETRLADLRSAGADMQLQRCGEQRRLCVRIATDAPTYGARADYRIVAGY